MICTGLDLLSLDGCHAILCCNSSVAFKKVRRFLRIASWIYKARKEKGLCSALRAWSVLHNSQGAVAVAYCNTLSHSSCRPARLQDLQWWLAEAVFRRRSKSGLKDPVLSIRLLAQKWWRGLDGRKQNWSRWPVVCGGEMSLTWTDKALFVFSSRQDRTDIRPQEYTAYGLKVCIYSIPVLDMMCCDWWLVHFLKWPRSRRFWLSCSWPRIQLTAMKSVIMHISCTAESWCYCMEVVVVKQLCSRIRQFQLCRLGAVTPLRTDVNDGPFPLRQCQRDCLDACAQGARVVEMACGSGKTRVMKELVSNISGKVAWSISKPWYLTSFDEVAKCDLWS